MGDSIWIKTENRRCEVGHGEECALHSVDSQFCRQHMLVTYESSGDTRDLQTGVDGEQNAPYVDAG